MNLKNRVAALEAATPGADSFSIEIHGEPTASQWAEINEAHAIGSMCLIFEMRGNSLGVWMPGADAVNWSAGNE